MVKIVLEDVVKTAKAVTEKMVSVTLGVIPDGLEYIVKTVGSDGLFDDFLLNIQIYFLSFQVYIKCIKRHIDAGFEQYILIFLRDSSSLDRSFCYLFLMTIS